MSAFALALCVLIFLPAGTLRYWQGWLFWTHFTVWTIGGTLYFLKHDPALVRRRLHAGPTAEQEPAQKRIQLFTSIAMCAIFVVSVLDHRWGWSRQPLPLIIAGHAMIAAGYLFMLRVFGENSFAASTIEVGTGQTVISTGPYAWIRHPMYAGALVMFLGIPLALGSWWGLVPVVLLVAGLVARLREEETFLACHLVGYDAYCDRVRWRLSPGLW